MKINMKHIIALCCAILFAMPQLQAQQTAKILKDYRGGKETMMVKIPGFVAKLALNTQNVDAEFKHAAKKVKNVRLFISENGSTQKFLQMKSELNAMFSSYDYKPLVQIKSDGETVQIQFLPATKKTRGEFVVLVQSEDELVAVVVEGKFTEEDVRQLAQHIQVDQF